MPSGSRENNIQLQEIEGFLKRFIEKENSLLSLKIMLEIPEQKSFLRNFIQVEKIALRLIENEAPKFNLFHIINIKHLEARVHTPFLAELLNPDGSHRQGRLFFDAFMKNLFGRAFNSTKITEITISKEAWASDNGTLDILISYEEASKLKAIVIENKIYHGNEKGQLKRYHHYLTQIRQFKDGEYHLIYLKPTRTDPTTDSISTELYKKLIESRSLIKWGYREDIALILNSVGKDIRAPVVKETVNQYIQTIQHL